MNFRTAEGASYEGRNADGNDMFTVSMPLDGMGYFGRECPSCHQIFRMHNEDYQALPDDLVLICPYCGHEDEHSMFVTPQQRERAIRVAKDAGMQLISEMLDKSFGSMARSTQNNKHVTVSYRSKPFFPEPLPGINEEELIRERTCPSCQVRYAVFGEHRFCPVSGELDSSDIARDALSAEVAKLDAMRDIPEPQRSILREKGVFDRIAVDTLGSVVSIVENLASAIFEQQVPEATSLLKGKGNIFQRLNDLAEAFEVHLAINVRSDERLSWASLASLWAARHAHVHNDGRVDAKYLRAIPNSTLGLGQRVVVSESDARTAITQAAALCEALATTTTPSPHNI